VSRMEGSLGSSLVAGRAARLGEAACAGDSLGCTGSDRVGTLGVVGRVLGGTEVGKGLEETQAGLCFYWGHHCLEVPSWFVCQHPPPSLA